MAAFGGVIINHVENHFDSGGVQIAHHGFDLAHLATEIAAAGVCRFRGEETDRIVTPVVSKSAIDQCLIIHVRLNGQQLDRGDAQMCEVLNCPGTAEPGISAAQFRRNVRAQFRESFHVQFVDD